MKKYYSYLNNSSFVKEIDEMRIKEQYVRITVLNFQEQPIQEIQGRVLNGNINLDGKSSVRRTANISMVATDDNNDLTKINSLISINKKINIEIGFKNMTKYYQEYPIIWFPLGIYVIVGVNLSHSLSSVNISLQLKDKMCLLNGECGGILSSSVVFHEYETVDKDGNYIISKPTIPTIIQELVSHFGGEQMGKIIVSDIDTKIKKALKWTGDTPLYRGEKAGSGDSQVILSTNLEDVKEGEYTTYAFGSDVGYSLVDFVYPTDLIGDVGNSVCDILDKIKNTLGNYEYFYDLNGNFIFQEVKNYLNTSYSKVILSQLNNKDYKVDFSKGKSVYSFSDGNLITSYSNSPQYGQIKNDFIVWGSRETTTGQKVPIRYHLAIDEKPRIGNTYSCFFYIDENDKIEKAKCPITFSNKNAFPRVGVEGTFYMDGENNKIYTWSSERNDYNEINAVFENITTTDWRSELYLSGISSEPYGTYSNYYFTELLNEWPKIYNVRGEDFYSEASAHPENIDYFLDFIDSNTAINELSISNIGRRTKTIVDDKINCVFAPDIPNYVILKTEENDSEEINLLKEECDKRGQPYIQVTESIYDMLAGGGASNSAYDLIRSLLYEYTQYNSSITLNTIPIYHLEPNTRITVEDSVSGIYGDYIINSISLPLDITGTSTISCTKALERF